MHVCLFCLILCSSLLKDWLLEICKAQTNIVSYLSCYVSFIMNMYVLNTQLIFFFFYLINSWLPVRWTVCWRFLSWFFVFSYAPVDSQVFKGFHSLWRVIDIIYKIFSVFNIEILLLTSTSQMLLFLKQSIIMLLNVHQIQTINNMHLLKDWFLK